VVRPSIANRLHRGLVVNGALSACQKCHCPCLMRRTLLLVGYHLLGSVEDGISMGQSAHLGCEDLSNHSKAAFVFL